MTAEWHDQATLTYTTLIDTTHRVTSLFNLFNVPTGILVDERGACGVSTTAPIRG